MDSKAVHIIAFALILGLAAAQNNCIGTDTGFCGDDCDNREDCVFQNCRDESCSKLCTCVTGCHVNAVESSQTGRCTCFAGFVSPGCNEDCSGACSLDGPPIVDDLGVACTDTSRCSCTVGCDADNFFFPNDPDLKYFDADIPDPGMTDWDTCRCHCTNGLTGELCDVELEVDGCHIRCETDA
jgi:hypothetical protein